jgi:hypothetical protein
MFRYALGNLIKAEPALPDAPEDGAFSLLRATANLDHPCLLEFSGTVAGHDYNISTRLVVTPHFSYGTNFLPQFRLSVQRWGDFRKKFPECARFLQADPRIRYVPPSASGFGAFEVPDGSTDVIAHIQRTWGDAAATLMADYYDPDLMMAAVLEDAYAKGQLFYVDPTGSRSGFLARTEGPCAFCVNRHWRFPLGCPYGKPDETPFPAGFLQKVAAAIVRSGAQQQPAMTIRRMVDDGFEARRGPKGPA